MLGERIARGFLMEKGYYILESNYRCPEGEVDLVARCDDVLVFVEVRTKTSLEFGSPEESITPAKMDRLRAVAAYYQQCHDGLPLGRRIDVVAIQMGQDNRPQRIAHIEDAVGGA